MLADVPAAAAFKAQPGKDTARRLVKDVLDIVRPFDGQASGLMLDAIKALGTRAQFHAERAELVRNYLSEHAHNEPNRKQGFWLLVSVAEQARTDGRRDMMVQYTTEAVKTALANGWTELAFKAADAGAIEGPYVYSKKFYLELSETARMRGFGAEADKYAEWAQLTD
jgi:hypothetical protein